MSPFGPGLRASRAAGPTLLFVAALAVLLMELSSEPLYAEDAARQAMLPPALPWSGNSRSLIVPKHDPWITPAERSDFKHSPSYDETVAWLKRLVAAAPELKLISLGKSPEGRDLWMVIASKERAFTPELLRATGKPILLAQGGIHAGEIDGKDAGLMLLRDMTVGRRTGARGARLLDGANFLFVPIFNVDGHERASRFGRINQRGPEETGWRTTSRNLNLNRDYSKLDSSEMRAMVQALIQWGPDLYLDLHVTDGADYQYDITWSYNGLHAWSPSIARWLERVLSPALTQDLKAMGHTPGLFGWIDPENLSKGVVRPVHPTLGPRISTGYGDARHLPTVGVESHALKPYDQRILGTYVLLESALKTLASAGKELREAITRDGSTRREKIPLAWAMAEGESPRMDFLGVESRHVPSAISGGLKIEWTGKPVTLRIPYLQMNKLAAEAVRPKAYWIPPAWSAVIERLQIHGIRMERIAEPRAVDVAMYRLENPKIASDPFEGHVTVTAKPVMEKRRERFPLGSVRVATDQPLGDLAMLLLEPASPDSFFQWGFFLEILGQTEYVEGYVMEPMAERMLAEDAKLVEEFRKKLLEDEAFRSSAKERLQWFYSKTPFFDERWRLYPVAREY